MATRTKKTCPWCAAGVNVSASACSKCQATLKPAVTEDIPGLTAVSAELSAFAAGFAERLAEKRVPRLAARLFS